MTYNTIAETQNYIVLDNYTKLSKVSEAPTRYLPKRKCVRTGIYRGFGRTRL